MHFKNPWWVVVGGVTGLFVCNGPVLAYTFGVFLKPLMADMGWQRSTASVRACLGRVPRRADGAGARAADGPLRHP